MFGNEKSWLVLPEFADTLDTDQPYESVPAYPAALRGIHFCKSETDQLRTPARYAELVPEPTNPFDACAVAVVCQGLRIGYLSSSLARSAQARLAYLRAHGNRCFVPFIEDKQASSFESFYPDSDSQWDVGEIYHFPDEEYPVGNPAFFTSQAFQLLFPYKEAFNEFDSAWDELGPEFEEKIRQNKWRFNDETYASFKASCQEYSIYPFLVDAVREHDSLLFEYLVWYRRQIYTLQNKVERLQRNLAIVEAKRKNSTNKELAEEFGLATSTIGKIFKEWNDTKNFRSLKKELRNSPSSLGEIKETVLQEHFDIDENFEEDKSDLIHELTRLDTGLSAQYQKEISWPDPGLSITLKHDTAETTTPPRSNAAPATGVRSGSPIPSSTEYQPLGSFTANNQQPERIRQLHNRTAAGKKDNSFDDAAPERLSLRERFRRLFS